MTAPASKEKPIYAKVAQDDGSATRMFMITCDEGWRLSIVCVDMYEWAADWLIKVLDRRPYASGTVHDGLSLVDGPS